MIQREQLDIFAVSLAIFFLLVVLMTLLRRWAGERFTVHNTDILLAIVPVALFLVFSGAVERIGVGGMFELKAVVARASALPISGQINQLPVQELESGPKGGINMIPQLIGQRTEVLTFRLGHGGYYGSAVREHLEELSKYPFFKYVVIKDRQGEFFGMIDAKTLLTSLSPALPKADFEDFAQWLNDGDREALSQLHGFIGRKEAIQPEASKRKAL
ncbi:MAG: hypothetical protein R3310_18040, partial [Candidatus Competibacteraceae bacterium]|nr:hypothetical protein [Candidatus Competibacteraceae bacterium]